MITFQHFDTKQHDGVTDICLVDTAFFDADSYAELQKELLELVETLRPRKLLVDLSRVQYCSTAVMNALLIAQGRLKSRGGSMRIYGMNENIHEAFRRLNLDRTAFQIYDTQAAAAK